MDKLIRITDDDLKALREFVRIYEPVLTGRAVAREMVDTSKRILASAERPVATFEGKVADVDEEWNSTNLDVTWLDIGRPDGDWNALDTDFVPDAKRGDRLTITIEVLK